MSAYESIMQGMNEALDHAKGKDIGARVDKVEVPTVNVAAIRASMGLSQGAFARSPAADGSRASAARNDRKEPFPRN